jgi:hypothetical protein
MQICLDNIERVLRKNLQKIHYKPNTTYFYHVSWLKQKY